MTSSFNLLRSCYFFKKKKYEFSCTQQRRQSQNFFFFVRDCLDHPTAQPARSSAPTRSTTLPTRGHIFQQQNGKMFLQNVTTRSSFYNNRFCQLPARRVCRTIEISRKLNTHSNRKNVTTRCTAIPVVITGTCYYVASERNQRGEFSVYAPNLKDLSATQKKKTMRSSTNG